MAASALALHRVDDRDAGVASALLNTTQQVGGALGTAVLNASAPPPWRPTSLCAHHLATGGAGERLGDLAALAGYQQAFAAGALLVVAAFVAVAVLVTVDRSSFAPTPRETTP